MYSRGCQIGFPTGRDSTTFRDKETEVPSLSRDKGTMGQAQNLDTGWDGPGQPIKIWDWTWDGTGQSLFFCQNPGRDEMGQSLFFSYDFLF